MAKGLTRRHILGKAAGTGALGIAAGAACSALPAPALAKHNPELSWRITSGFPESLEIIIDAAKVFVAYVAEASDNRFRMTLVPAEKLGTKLDVAEAVTKGKIEIAHTSSGFYWQKDPTFALASGLPFGLNSRQMSAWMLEGGGNELLDQFFAKHNIFAIGAGGTGCRMGGWWRDEIGSLEDLQGKTLLTDGFSDRIMIELGIKTTGEVGGDIAKAFKAGRIDAVEWVGPYDDEKLGLAKVAKNYYYPGWWAPGPMLHMFINRAKWESLPRAYQVILQGAGCHAAAHTLARYDAKNPAALKRMLRRGVQLRAFPRPVMEAAFDAAEKLYASTASSNTSFKKVYDNWYRFRADQYLWSQVAELGLDAFQSEAVNKAARPR